ncbi:hypothetical protein C8J57DRAFT_1247497 [Mycena rebaudengoi]|nr:hypothetical protein C8J57DRAFT_1247497 [Mycena rebaudengoi]
MFCTDSAFGIPKDYSSLPLAQDITLLVATDRRVHHGDVIRPSCDFDRRSLYKMWIPMCFPIGILHSRLNFGRCFHSIHTESGTAAMAASGHDDKSLAKSAAWSFLDPQPPTPLLLSLATHSNASAMAPTNARPKPRSLTAAPSSSPTPLAKGKGKSIASTSTPVATAPGPPTDPWIYLRNDECRALMPILDTIFCDTENNHLEVIRLLEAASTPLLKHLSTWMSVPPDTAQFLAQLRHAVVFALQIKPASSKLKILKDRLPKKLPLRTLLTSSFVILAEPCRIKTMAELSFSSDKEDNDTDDSNLAEPPADLDDQPEPPADDEPEVVEEEELLRPKKRKRTNPLPDDDYEDEPAELSTPINSRSSPIKTHSSTIKVEKPELLDAPVASSSKVKPRTPRMKCYVFIPPQLALKTPVAKATAGTNKSEKTTPAKKASTGQASKEAPARPEFPRKIMQLDEDPDSLDKTSKDTRVHARNKNEVPNPEAVPTATMVLPLAQVYAAQIDPNELNFPFVCSNCAISGNGDICVSQGFHKSCELCHSARRKACSFTASDFVLNVVCERILPMMEMGNPHLSLLFNNMISLHRQYDFHNALAQLYLDDYLKATEDLAFTMCALLQTITHEALAARFSDESAIDTLDIFFERLQLTPEYMLQRRQERNPPPTVHHVPSTSGFPEDDHSRYPASLPTQTNLSGRLFDKLDQSPSEFAAGLMPGPAPSLDDAPAYTSSNPPTADPAQLSHSVEYMTDEARHYTMLDKDAVVPAPLSTPPVAVQFDESTSESSDSTQDALDSSPAPAAAYSGPSYTHPPVAGPSNLRSSSSPLVARIAAQC